MHEPNVEPVTEKELRAVADELLAAPFSRRVPPQPHPFSGDKFHAFYCALCGLQRGEAIHFTTMSEAAGWIPREGFGQVDYPDNSAAQVMIQRALEDAAARKPQTHAEVVNARIAAFPRAVIAVRNEAALRDVLSERDILKLAVELVK
jgi:hypothetical protein